MAKSSNEPAHVITANWLRRPSTQEVFEALGRDGNEVRAVGGCVRNAVLAELGGSGCDQGPTTDIDLATTATPDVVTRLAEGAGLRVVPTGMEHGTVTVLSNGQPFEVTTLRRDVSTDGRRATVAFTEDWAADARRRDLTINALYADSRGRVFDPVDGLDDIRARRIRFVGDPAQRISEDYLRILRFFRFFAQYGAGMPDPEGVKAAVHHRRGMARLSAERIRQELMKLLMAPGAVSTLEIMAQHGLLGEFLPACPTIGRLRRLIDLSGRHGLPTDAGVTAPAARLAALAVTTASDADRLARHLRLSRAEAATLDLAGRLLDERAFTPPDHRQARRRAYALGHAGFAKWVSLAMACRPRKDIANGTGATADWTAAVDVARYWEPPPFPLDGRDLMKLGFAPGPELGDALAALENAWIASDFRLSPAALKSQARAACEQRGD